MDYQKFLDGLPNENRRPWVSEAKLSGAAIKRFLPAGEGIILFVGGGTGKFACAVGLMGHKVMMLEVSKAAVDVAFARIKQNNLNLRVVPIWEDFGKLKFDDNTFDLVVAERGILSMCPDADFSAGARELSRVAKKGGKIIGTFFLKSPSKAVKIRKFDESAAAAAFGLPVLERTQNSGAACLVFSKA